MRFPFKNVSWKYTFSRGTTKSEDSRTFKLFSLSVFVLLLTLLGISITTIFTNTSINPLFDFFPQNYIKNDILNYTEIQISLPFNCPPKLFLTTLRDDWKQITGILKESKILVVLLDIKFTRRSYFLWIFKYNRRTFNVLSIL